MMNYTPDGWILVQICSDEPHYRVFGSWGGGFIDGDSWRMNSGITKIEEDDNNYIFSGYSGSKYTCNKGTYGRLTGHNRGVAERYADNSDGKMVLVREMPDLYSLKLD